MVLGSETFKQEMALRRKMSLPSESRHEGVSRRNFIKALAGGAGAAAASLALPLEAMAAAQEASDANRAAAIKSFPGDPFKLNDQYKRYNGWEIAFNQVSRELGKHWGRVYNESRVKKVLEGYVGTGIKVDSVGLARIHAGVGVGLFATANVFNRTGEGYENKGSQSWSAMTLPPLGPEARPPDITDPVPLTRYTKAMARMAGASLVGIAPFDERWIYTHSQRNAYQPEPPILKPFRIEDIPVPKETDEALIIPANAKSVIVVAFAMDRVMTQTSPGWPAGGTTGLGYTRMGIATVALADFIRTQGYWAIPSTNCTAMSVPTAIAAGLGEQGRLSVLVTPEFGPNVRLAKVYTNMPLTPDKPIDFGVEDFCNSCMKCARECPAKCIPEGPKTWVGHNEANNPGALKWYTDGKKCLHFWMENGSSCSSCLGVCPFTKGDLWAHGATEWTIKNMPFLNGIWLTMDDAFGYGERRDPDSIWEHAYPYGIDAEVVAKTKKNKGGA